MLIPIAKLGQQRERLIRSLEAGLSATHAAETAGMHERSAFRARKRLKKAKPQGKGRLDPEDKQPKLL